MKTTTLLSLDTSTTTTGYSVFVNAEYDESGILSTAKANDKFNVMAIGIIDLMNNIRPDIIVIEQVNVSRNMVATRKLCALVGVVHGWAIEHGVDCYEIGPTEWRGQIGIQSKGRTRNEFKALSKAYAEEKIGIKDITDDESDAVCIGLAYIKKWSMDQEE